MSDDGGIEVNDRVEMESLEDVVEAQFVMEPQSKVLLELRKVSATETKDGGFKQLEVGFVIAEGIEVGGELKFKGAFASTFPTRIFYHCEPWKKEEGMNKPKQTTKDWYKNKQC